MSDENNKQNNDELADEIDIDEDTPDLSLEDTSGDNQGVVRKMKEKLKVALKEKDDYLLGWQRCRADFVNAKKAHENERMGVVAAVSESLMTDLLPVLDSFDLAFADKSNAEKVSESWRAGVLSIYSKMMEILGRRGLEQIGHVGDKFDVNMEEPVAMTPVDKEELDDTVTEVFQKGYSLNGRVIRPAKVKVGEYNKV